jgi:hypothetical protein
MGYRGKPAAELGAAPTAPTNLTLNAQGPVARPLFQTVTGGFAVNTDSREEVRSFYNAIFPTSDNVPQNSTADAPAPACTPGHNSDAFQEAELRRINWYRAMAGMPAAIFLDPVDCWGSQQMAVIQSANNVLDHNPTNTYLCYNTNAAHYAGGDQSLGADGAEAIQNFIWDFGAKNNEVGHRRWILYPSEIVMGVGDIPATGTANASANLTYVFDPASFGPRPATRQPYVAWPPEGFTPYQVVYPYWSFGVSNANFTNAVVTMTSNGTPVSVAIQPYQVGFGENTIVWVPMGLDATTEGTSFPFGGTDTVYNVTVSNVSNNGSNVTYNYNVTVFDPSAPGVDYIPAALNGPAQAMANTVTVYSVAAPNNPHVTSYNYATAQLTPGNLFDNATSGLVNFSLSPPTPNYDVVTSDLFSSTPCFNLRHETTNSFPQLLQFNEALVPASNTMLSFESELGYATTNEVARVQASSDGGNTWQDLYAQPGVDNSFETSFTQHTLSLSNYAGETTMLRFNFDFQGGEYEADGDPLGWYVTDILLTNVQQEANQTTNYSMLTGVVPGNFEDSATHGWGNFTLTPPPYYYITTNPPVGAEPFCFHLAHLDSTSQFMQLNETLVPSSNTVVDFSSQIGYATTDETARVQVSIDGGNTWNDLYVEAGSGGPGETNFTPHSLSLSNYSGVATLLRFNYAFTGGGYYPASDNNVGWNIEDIAVTNVQQLQTTTLDTTNFAFAPTQPGTYIIQAQPVIFGQFPLSFGPVKTVTVTSQPVITLNTPVATNNQVQLNFTMTGGPATSFHLLQASQLPASVWTTNTTAVFSTNIAGSSYRFTDTKGAAARYYRVETP